MLNKVLLIGNLGKDPEVRRMNNGDPIVSFSLATSENWKDKQTGERKSKTEWHNIVIFNPHIADVAEKYLKKGSKCFVEGSLQTRKWTDKEGKDRYSTEVVLQKFRGGIELLDGKSGGGDRDEAGADTQAPANGYADQKGRGAAPAGGGYAGDLDDAIPFAPEWR